MMEMSPISGCTEYCFKDDYDEKNDKLRWRVSLTTLLPIQQYQGLKFDLWKKSLFKPDCEAAFKRSLQLGIIYNVYDENIFPTPDEYKHLYTVINQHGKEISLPHPIFKMRTWNSETKSYDYRECRLKGAPSEKDLKSAWEKILEELYEASGKDYVQGLMKSDIN
jgi:hypothetical protein